MDTAFDEPTSLYMIDSLHQFMLKISDRRRIVLVITVDEYCAFVALVHRPGQADAQLGAQSAWAGLDQQSAQPDFFQERGCHGAVHATSINNDGVVIAKNLRRTHALQLSTNPVPFIQDRYDDYNPAATLREQMLGEIWSYAEMTRACLNAAIEGAKDSGSGMWLPDSRPFSAIRATMPGWMVRTNEIIRQIGSHHIFTTPSRGELDDPGLRPLIDHHLAGVGDVDAEMRSRVFRLGWDFAGSGLAVRNEQYERFYLGSAARNYQMAHINADRTRADQLVDRFLTEDLN